MVGPAPSLFEARRLSFRRTRHGFRALAGITVLATFALVTLGGVVRVTGSGLACPDWPLCYGQVIPPLDVPTLIEYSHRLAASVVSLLVVVTALAAWRWYQGERWIVVAATLGLVLLGVQVILGGLTVLLELPGVMVAAHLAAAEALLATMVVVYVGALRSDTAAASPQEGTIRWDRFSLLVVGTTAAMYGLVLTGSYVTVSGAAVACGTWWPLCLGEVLPLGVAQVLHMIHRLGALLVGILVAITFGVAWPRCRQRPDLGWTALAVGGLFLMQVAIGAANVLLAFPLVTQLLHLTMATAVWLVVAGMAALTLLPPKVGEAHAVRP